MPRPKRPVVATKHGVTISRQGEYAIIKYKDPGISSVHLKVGPEITDMTDQEILNLHNTVITRMNRLAAEYHHVAVEIPPGKPQVAYSKMTCQWVPKGDVLRCLIHANEKGELVVEIDNRDFNLQEFGRMLTTFEGWGMRIEIVPDDEIEKRPDIVVKNKKR